MLQYYIKRNLLHASIKMLYVRKVEPTATKSHGLEILVVWILHFQCQIRITMVLILLVTFTLPFK